MNDKTRLEAIILRSFLEYPSKIDEFLSQMPLKCFSADSAALLKIILDLKDKELLNLETLNIHTPDSLKNCPFFIEFLAAIPNVLVLKFKDTLLKAYRLEMQKKLLDTLNIANQNNELVDLELLQKELSVETKSYLTLSQWLEYYRQKPKVPSLKTGIEFLDICFNGGIELGQFVLVGGDPEAGKTMLGLQMIENIAKNNKVAFFCFEFTIEQYLKRVEEKNIRTNFYNIIILNEGYHIFELADNIRNLYRQGVRVFFIDSQMRLTHTQGRNMEEEETMKFSTLARLCHSLGILIVLVIQNAKGDKENPMGSKKGGHEANIIIRIERLAPSKDDIMQKGNIYDENSRLIIVQKNKQTGRHFKEKVFFNTKDLKFYPIDKNSGEFVKKVDFKEVLNEIQNG